MKRHISILLTAVMLFALIPFDAISVFAAETYTDSQGVTYTLGDDSTHYIVFDFDDSVTEVVIPSAIDGVPVTTIGDEAFKGCRRVTSITIPDGVTSIGVSAFYQCNSLTSITIPDSVTTIGDRAIFNCYNLTSITIPDSVTTIGYMAFSGCGSLTSLTIPDSVTMIGDYAFHYCGGLTSITIGNSVTTIGEYAFFKCSELTSLTIPDSVTTIGYMAFAGCFGLTSLTIPDSVMTIGDGAFAYCYDLTSIKADSGNSVYHSKNNCLIETATSTLIQGCKNSVIPNYIMAIGGFAFAGCDSLISVTIPDSVTTIGESAFSSCDSLAIITIPDSVMTIGKGAFSFCYGLISVTISDSVTTIGDSAFSSCNSLASLTIPDSVTTIGYMAFEGCHDLTSVTIPDSVTTIGGCAFSFCYGLISVTIPDSVTTIGDSAFSSCDNLSDIYCEAISKPDGWDLDWNGSYYATVHWGVDIDDSNSSTANPNNSVKQLYFEEPIVILDVSESKTLKILSRDVDKVNGELIYSNENTIVNEDLFWSVATGFENIIEVTKDGTVKGLSNGLAILSARHRDNINLATTLFVYVGDPNALHYTSTYDTKQYYADGGFYSEVSSISDCVEIYILLENKLKEAVANISGIDETIAKDTEKLTFKDIKPITLTASVNGTGLSFDRDTYTNTYTVTLDTIFLTQAVDDILMLFPNNLTVASSGNNYTVTVTLESESFETITDEYSFTVENLETKSANEHIDFISSNNDYKVSKQNIYGETMVTLKNDAEYKWSKYSTLDFDNYYEIVLADVIISMLQVNQVEIHSLVSSVLKEWRGTYKTLSGGITTIVEDNYADRFGNTERKIDKLLKKSKYETDGIYVKDELYETVMDLLGNADNTNKINNVFKAMDKTGQVFGMANLGGNILSDAVDWGNKISIFNAYVNADNEFKTVMKSFADSIPESEKKMREAIYDYVNYAENDSAQISELLESFSGLMKNVTLDVFSSCVGGRMIDYLGVQLVNWVGTATVGGVAFSTTATFATVKTTLGSVSTGVTLGLCFSDLICDSSGKAAEMGKVVAMSEFSPYVIQTLLRYENKLKEDKNISATTYYEYAFALHKATQSYIMNHTVNSLETKRDSLIIRIFNRDDYDGLISDILAQKRIIDNLYCHSSISTSTVVSETKVIAIKCPVNVFVYDESGKEVVRIVNDIKEYIEDGINVFVENGEKYIALPVNQEYSVRIISTGSGTMEYAVTEYGAGGERLRCIEKSNIPLEKNREFAGCISEQINATLESYALTYDDKTVELDEVFFVEPSNEPHLGDVDGDSTVNQFDHLMVKRYYFGTLTFTDDQKLRADVDSSGDVDQMDYLYVKRHYFGTYVIA